jgi:hypothetical protein
MPCEPPSDWTGSLNALDWEPKNVKMAEPAVTFVDQINFQVAEAGSLIRVEKCQEAPAFLRGLWLWRGHAV